MTGDPVPQRLHSPKERFVSMYSCASQLAPGHLCAVSLIAVWPFGPIKVKLFVILQIIFITSVLLSVASVSVNRKAANQNITLNDIKHNLKI